MSKFFSLFLLASLTAALSAFAVAPKEALPHGKFKIAYQIAVPSQELPGGEQTMPQLFNIERLPKSEYLQKTIYVKTKNLQALSSGMNAFYSSALMSDLEQLQIKSIRAPFEFAAAAAKEANKPRIMATVAKIYEVNYESDIDPYDICMQLMKNPEVEYAVPVFIRHLHDYSPNDPMFGQQGYLNSIQAKKAWDVCKGSKNVIVAIVDSGVDIDHVDLKANIFVNKKEIPTNGKDDDSNGFIDDVNGWDFVGNVSASQAATGTFNPDNNVRPGSSHGTHVAGLAAGITDNSTGIASIGFNLTILPLKHGLDANSSGVYRGYEGILYAATMGAHVINCSWGGYGSSPAEQEIINQAKALGSVVVVSSGNEGSNLDESYLYPAAHDNVITVGATNNSDQWVNFSNYGMKVTLYAPGNNVISTIPGNQYQAQSGTSMSSPIAAGIAALVRAVHPDWTPDQVYWHMRNSTDKTITQDTNAKPLFFGRINAFKAVTNGLSGENLSYGVGFVLDNPDEITFTDYEPKLVKLKCKNYLASIGNMKVKLTPLDKYISLSKTEFTVQALPSGATHDYSIQMQLLQSNPWFRGEARILVTYEAANYINYELLKLPIRIKSDNKFVFDAEIPEYYPIIWADGAAPDVNSFFAAGYLATGQGVLYGNKIPGKLFSIPGNSPSLYSIYAKDANNLFVSGGTQTTSAVFKSTNGGQSWTSQNTTSITPFVNKVWFFNDNDGLLLGDPTSLKWGIGLSSDGGANWRPAVNLPPFFAGETGFVGSVAFLGDNAWFGTTKGRVFHSSDKGVTWSQSTVFKDGHVTYLCFMNKDSGMVVYHEGEDLVPPQKTAYTFDGGKTWIKNVSSSADRYLWISSLYFAPDSKWILAMHTGGEIYNTIDFGKTWNPVLGQKSGASRIGAATALNGKVRFWGAHKTVKYLEFTYPLLNVVKTIVVNKGVRDIVFDSCELGKYKTFKIPVTNTGNQTINFSSFEFTGNPDGDFSFFLSKPNDIDPNEELNLNIRFSPKKTGERTGTLIIKSDSDTPEISINLKGVGYDLTGIENVEIVYSALKAFPNPANDMLNINMTLKQPQQLSIALFSSTGALAARLFEGYVPDRDLEFEANLATLPSGSYYLIVNGAISGQVVISR